MIKLRFVDLQRDRTGSAQLTQCQVYQREWTIGRGEECDLSILGEGMSRQHAKVRYDKEQYYLNDAKSTNGTLVNGVRLDADQAVPLQCGDVLQLGKVTLYIEELIPLAAADHTAASQRQPEGFKPDLLLHCYRIITETPDTKTFYLTCAPPILFYYLPGQFITLEVEIEGQSVRRPYSLSSSPSRPYSVSITVKRVPGGLVSNWLNDHFQVGDTLKVVREPTGHFTCLPSLPPKLLFLGAGSGITPLMSMSRWLFDTASDADTILIYSARSPIDLIFQDELRLLTSQMSSFRLYPTVTRPQPQTAWAGLRGRISDAMLQLLVPDLLDRTLYACGPGAFLENIQTALERLNFPMAQYHQESFGSSKPQSIDRQERSALSLPPRSLPQLSDRSTATALLDRSQEESSQSGLYVCFNDSQRTVKAHPDRSILETAEQFGVTIPSACRFGVCGACKVFVAEGAVTYRAQAVALSETEKSAGYTLACIACPVDRIAVAA